MKSNQFLLTLAFVSAVFLGVNHGFAQTGGGGGGPGGGGGGGGDVGGGIGGGGTDIGGGGNTGGGGGQTNANAGGSEGFDTSLDLGFPEVVIPDLRNQGFVGPTSVFIQERGFIGAASPALGNQPVEGSYGGGVNSGGGGGGGAAGRNAGGLQGQRGLGAGAQPGFQVMRSNLRAPLVNRIEFVKLDDFQVADRFQIQTTRIPQLDNVSGSYSLQVERGVAIVTGLVPDQASANRIEQMLRLEPGIYKIDNRLRYPQ